MKKRQLSYIITGIQPWDTFMGSNCKSIALELSKKHRVVYLNLPLDIATLYRHRNEPSVRRHLEISAKKRGKRYVSVNENLRVYYPGGLLLSANWLPSGLLFDNVLKWNNHIVGKSFKEALGILDSEEFVLFNDNDIFRTYYLKEKLKPKCYVFYVRDYLMGVDYWRRHGHKYEPLHIAKADLAFANSEYLARYLRQYNVNSFDIGQGCNLELYNSEGSYDEPSDLKHIKRPRVGYVGALNSLRIDQNIISSISEKLPEFQIVLVGPEDDSFKNSNLHDRTNIHFLGRKVLAEIPGYIKHFDVCINPQLYNPVTAGNYPLKVDEYLAMGKPVVATRTEATEVFGNLIETVISGGDFADVIENAYRSDSVNKRQQRIELAKSHSWEVCVKKIDLFISRYLDGQD